MRCLERFSTPQLEKIHSGKVRESFLIDSKTRMIVATDRLSAFDRVLGTPIPHKGAVLTGISNYWFQKTDSIVENHLVDSVDPNVVLVRETEPIRVEMIVRGYMVGSMWRGYLEGKRVFSGVHVPDGIEKHGKLPEPIITPTTKEKHDREITPEAIVETGLVDSKTYQEMERVSLELFEAGTAALGERNIILADTKYEFGLVGRDLVLIDEIHTPDSSRFWYANEYENDRENVAQMDKEFVRTWLLEHEKDGELPNTLPGDVVDETMKRYLEMYEAIIGMEFGVDREDIKERIYRNLVRAGIIKDGYVAVIMGSTKDLEHSQAIRETIEKYGIMADLRVVSAHKNPEELVPMAQEYNSSIEPGAAIAVAGLSNGLGGALAANLSIPVFNCPPFKDRLDMLININSSLMLPSKTPAATVLAPASAAMAAMRSLNIHRLRDIFNDEIREVKKQLLEADHEMRGK
jgi:phosphoribosylaminoimidazole-succinocarboxamide synthase